MKFLIALLLLLESIFAYDILSSKVFFEAQNIFHNMKRSSYSYHSRIDAKNGIYICDCSTFVSFVVGRVSKRALSALPVDKHHKHPRAKNFYNTFSKLSIIKPKMGWIGVDDITKVQIGDIIAWKYDRHFKKRDTGHVVIVYSKPMLERNGLYRVTVIDSSKGRHSNDSRVKGINGIGIGDILFRVNKEKKLISFYWSDRSKKESTHPILIGRVVKNTTP